MDDVTGNEQELFVKHVIQQFMKDQLKERKKEKQEDNNSFVFLEKSTLNMVLTYLFMNEGKQIRDVNEDSQEKVIEELEHLIADNQNDFEEILTLLKERS